MNSGRPAAEQPEADEADALEQATPRAGPATPVEAGDQPAVPLAAPEADEADEADALEQATPRAGPATPVEAGEQPAVPLEAPEADALEQQAPP